MLRRAGRAPLLHASSLFGAEAERSGDPLSSVNRCGEALALRVGDLDLLRRTVSITRASTEVAGQITIGETKTGKSRGLAITPVVAEALAAHIGAFVVTDASGLPRRDALIFTSEEG